jgi:hypothetical protein
MRALLLLVMALTVASIGPAVAAPVNVVDIVRDPRAYIDQRLAVSGIMGHGTNGYWAICPLPEDRAQLAPATPQRPICIDLRLRDRDAFETRSEKYRGAIVTITGPYWNRCLAEIKEHEPEVVREECKDWGLNGYLGAETIAIRGYSDPTQLINGVYGESPMQPDPMTEIAPPSEAAAEIDAFVQTFLAAVRARDTNALALLYPKEVRGFARVGFGAPATRLYWLVLSPEMAVAGAGASRQGTGYRVYGGDRQALVCFCRRNSCTGAWPRSTGDAYATNVATPTVCHNIERIRGTWWLRR